MRCTGSHRSPVPDAKNESHAAELRRCLDRLPARQIGGWARRARAGGRRFLPQRRRRHGAARRPGGICRRHLDRSVRPHDRRPRLAPRRSTFDTRRGATTRPRWRSCAPSPASRNMPSMTRGRRPETGPIGAARIPFDQIEAIHVGSTTLVDEKGARPKRSPWSRMRADQPPSPSIRIAGPTWSSTRPATSSGWMRLPRPRTSCGCRMSTLNFCTAVAITREGRSHSLRRAPAWSSSRAESRELRRGIKEAGAVEVAGAGRQMSWTPSAPVTVFRPPCCSPCAPSDGSSEALAHMNSDELRRALSFASGCAAFTCGRAGADPPRELTLRGIVSSFSKSRGRRMNPEVIRGLRSTARRPLRASQADKPRAATSSETGVSFELAIRWIGERECPS